MEESVEDIVNDKEQYLKKRKYIWELILDSDMNVRYWKYLVRRYSNYDKFSKIFLALMSSGTVASWTIWNNVPLLLQFLSSCSAVIAVALPILNFQKNIETMSDLSGKHAQIKNEYESIWSTLSRTSNIEKITQQCEKIKEKEVSLVKQESKLPKKKKLLLQCHKEVLKARGV